MLQILEGFKAAADRFSETRILTDRSQSREISFVTSTSPQDSLEFGFGTERRNPPVAPIPHTARATKGSFPSFGMQIRAGMSYLLPCKIEFRATQEYLRTPGRAQ